MYIAEQDRCISTECPRYSECRRAHRDGAPYQYFKNCARTEWCDTEGHHGSDEFYYCGEKGNWRRFLKYEVKNE